MRTGLQGGKIKYSKFPKGFTLIELLVVIAVVGLLSSFVLVVLNSSGTKEKARIGQVLQYSVSLQNLLGAEGLGAWTFDEGPGNTIVKDSSGYGNDGTIMGGASFTDDTPFKIIGAEAGKYALQFNGSSNYVRIANLKHSNVVTLEMWVKADETGRGWEALFDDNAGLALWAYNGQPAVRLRYEAGDALLLYFGKTWTADRWTHLAFSWDVNAPLPNVRTYWNGQPTNTGNYTIGAGAGLTAIGASRIGAANFKGVIDEVRFYGMALAQAEIQNHYAESLTEHLASR